MPELLRNTTAAYNKGALSAASEGCPYTWNKRQLQAWWHAGREDRLNNQLDYGMCYDSTLARLGLSRPAREEG